METNFNFELHVPERAHEYIFVMDKSDKRVIYVGDNNGHQLEIAKAISQIPAMEKENEMLRNDLYNTSKVNEQNYSNAIKFMEENESLKKVNAELIEALNGILASWDKSMRGDREQFKDSEMLPQGYWSPATSMVESEYISKARTAIENATK
jgi:hypothetical protein